MLIEKTKKMALLHNQIFYGVIRSGNESGKVIIIYNLCGNLSEL